MEVRLIRENEDGSADYTFDMTDEERDGLLLFALRTALVEAVKKGLEWQAPSPTEEEMKQMELFDENS